MMNATQKSPPTLSICIPTYNRSQQLGLRLREITEQLTEEVELVVVNNASTDQTDLTIDSSNIRHRIKYHKNNVNLGLGANLLECIKHSTGEWIWILGDDDAIKSTSIAMALEEIRSCPPDCINILFTWYQTDPKKALVANRFVKGVEEYYSTVDLSTSLFISTNIYRRKTFTEKAACFASSIFTLGPHLATFLQKLDEGTSVSLLSTKTLLNLEHHNQPRWSTLEAIEGLSTIPIFLASSNAKRRYCKRFREFRDWALKHSLSILPESTLRKRYLYSFRFSLYNAMLNDSPLVIFKDWRAFIRHYLKTGKSVKLDILIQLYGLLGWDYFGNKLFKNKASQGLNILFDR